MRQRQRGVSDEGVTLVLGLVVLLIILGVVCAVASLSCKARWEGSGLQSSWGPMQGCLVRLPDGRWIPDDRLREIDVAVGAKK